MLIPHRSPGPDARPESPVGPGISIFVGLYEDADAVIRERERSFEPHKKKLG